MPCFSPMVVTYTTGIDGKKLIKFNTEGVFNTPVRSFYEKNIPVSSLGENVLQLPCSGCIGCRLEKSRQWAARVMHEASLYEDNCFITLTYSDEYVPSDMSLDKKHMQDFWKRLRFDLGGSKVRYFYCGEYGDRTGRPHYHSAVFNFVPSDKKYWKTVKCGGEYYDYFTSDSLNKLWGKGYVVIGELTFDSAAYIARYTMKKINGKLADDHYSRVNGITGEVYKILPEFSQASLKPGIGKGWYDKFGMTDIYPLDEMVVNGVKTKPVRYYDKQLEKFDPGLFLSIKEKRDVTRVDKSLDNVYTRLRVKEKCQEIRLKKLVRNMDEMAFS